MLRLDPYGDAGTVGIESGLRALYYANRDLRGQGIARLDPQVNDQAPAAGINKENGI